MNFGRQILDLLRSMGWLSSKDQEKRIGKELKRIFDGINLLDMQNLRIFSKVFVKDSSDAKFPLDFYRPSGGQAEDETFKTFVALKEGMVQAAIDGDEMLVPTYKIANSASWSIDYKNDNRVDVLLKSVEVFFNGFANKIFNNQMKIIVSAGMQGFNKPTRFINLCSAHNLFKERSGSRASKITDMLVEPELMADVRDMIRKGQNDAVDSSKPHEVITYLTTADDIDTAKSLEFKGIRFHEVCDISKFYDEIYGQKPKGKSWIARLADLIGFGKFFGNRKKSIRICVALDLADIGSFVQVIVGGLKLFEDDGLSIIKKEGFYGWFEVGSASLDSRRAIVFEEPREFAVD